MPSTTSSPLSPSFATPEAAEELVPEILFRLTDGLPRVELEGIVAEAKTCEDLLEREIALLEEELAKEEAANAVAETKDSGGDVEMSQQQDPQLSDGNDNTGEKTSNDNKKEEDKQVKVSSSAPRDRAAQVDFLLESEITPADSCFTISALLGRLRDPVAVPLPPHSKIPALRAARLPPPPKKKKSTTPTAEIDVGLSALDKHRQIIHLYQNEEYTRERDPATLLTVFKKISGHRTSLVFRRPVNPKEAPGYTDRIRFPIDLSLIRKLISAGVIKSYAELHRKIAVICHNCIKFNGRESDYGVVTREFEGHVETFLRTATAKSAASRPVGGTPKGDPPGTSLAAGEKATGTSSDPSSASVPKQPPASAK